MEWNETMNTVMMKRTDVDL